MNVMTPAYLEDIFENNIGRTMYNLRTAVKTDYYWKSFDYTGAKIWNALPDNTNCEKNPWELSSKN